jgi:DegV family protein with EDD domain
MIGTSADASPGAVLDEVLAASPGTVRTSCPAPAAYLAAIDGCHSGDGVLICTTAASLSGSYQAALKAAQQARVPVRVIDTETAAGGQGLIVLAAAGAAAAGADLDTVADIAGRCGARVHLVGTVDGLDHLAASGRVPHLVSRAVGQLGVHPVFELHAGRIRELWPARSEHAAEVRMLDRLRALGKPGSALHVSVLHGCAPDRAQRVLEMVVGVRTPATAYISEFDVAMAAHLGPGVVGLAWRWEPPGGLTG